MEVDEIIDSLLTDETPSTRGMSAMTGHWPSEAPALTGDSTSQDSDPPPSSQLKREWLAALVAGGQARQYLSKEFTIEQINSLPKDEIERLYMCYESRLGEVMTKTLRQAVIQLYTTAVSWVFPNIPPKNLSSLVDNLNADPFLGHALNGACCELYHHYGMWLAPLTTVLTTAKHCRFEQASTSQCIRSDGETGASEGPQESGGRPTGSTGPKGEAGTPAE